MTPTQKTYEEIQKAFALYLESKKLRKTQERFAILKEIYTSEGHFDVDTLYVRMQHQKYRVSRATVYNTLHLLLACHMVKKHQFGQATALYEKAFGYHQHDHLICTKCNKVMEFCDPRIQNIQNTIEEQFQFNVLRHSLVLYASCQRKNCDRSPE